MKTNDLHTNRAAHYYVLWNIYRLSVFHLVRWICFLKWVIFWWTNKERVWCIDIWCTCALSRNYCV